ncbi:MAG: hypothetical protein COU07_01205 [Candidatus Harrisonbacteria bacterium CG10_big_fil_rev_8_21_14_0_10_40_38]|uniref:Ribosomal RNA small subunit methyltransferase E n=1 Tax=Candidatus Harrisonbacteria bacterium CG10_big_fil_rev_8_21_14_0_10_40_38 TaxID=1974583 RepID=A0A2H0USZ0_9BACT|nr:MAG: hypothetical protein COU07_01205 [Candidatus Harrisonbacteria bacterium CG10_big_fil_rev_8_21_14_0_10_40_38]
MRLHRFFAEFDLSQSVIKITDDSFRHQVKDVLRLREGDSLVLAHNTRVEVTARITSFLRDGVELVALSHENVDRETERLITLYASLIKHDHFEFAVQKAVECGVAEIVPILSDRTEKLRFKEERIQKIIQEAAEQSGRAYVPKLLPTMSLPHALQMSSRHDINLFFDVSVEDFFSKKILRNKKNIGVFVGPEGGWSSNEVVVAKSYTSRTPGKLFFVSLGELTLRAETASIIVSFLASHSIGA